MIKMLIIAAILAYAFIVACLYIIDFIGELFVAKKPRWMRKLNKLLWS